MSEGGQPGNGWSRYESQVLYRLDELNRKVDQLDDKMHNRVGGVQARILTMQEDVDRRIEALDNRIDGRIDGVQSRINDLQTAEIGELRTEVALLKLKAGVWGALCGMVPAGLVVLYTVLQGGAP